MATCLYRCPITRQKVQGFVANDVFDAEGEVFESITCSACGQVHLVNPKTGKVKVVGADDPQQ